MNVARYKVAVQFCATSNCIKSGEGAQWPRNLREVGHVLQRYDNDQCGHNIPQSRQILSQIVEISSSHIYISPLYTLFRNHTNSIVNST